MNEYIPADQQNIDNIPDEVLEEPTLVEDFEEWEDECERIRKQEETAVGEAEEASDRAIESNHR